MSPLGIITMQVNRDLASGLTEEQAMANADVMMMRAAEQASPQKAWFDASLDHRAAIYRALQISPSEEYAAYAIAPFRMARNEDGAWRVLAAWPCPPLFTADIWDWLNIDEVIEWNPTSDTAIVLGDPVPQIVGNLSDDANQIHASPRAFFQQWAIRRARFCATREKFSNHWTKPPAERDEAPGALVIGDLAKIKVNPATMPEHIECHGVDARDLNRAILRAAHLPRAIDAASSFRRAA